MFLRNRFISLFFAAFLAFAATPATGQNTPQLELPLHFTAFAVSTGGPLTSGGAAIVDISVSRWSNVDESTRLLNTLKNNGSEALLDELADAKPVGTIRTPGSLAYDLRYAQQENLGDGMRRIILVTDRPMSMWEAVNRPPSYDYPFTVIELRINQNGEGEGTLSVAANITASRNGKLIQLTNYDTQPVRLNEVRLADR